MSYVIIIIHAGSTVYDLSSKREFVSKAEFTGHLVQDKLGFFYYEANGRRYRVKREEGQLIRPGDLAHAATA